MWPTDSCGTRLPHRAFMPTAGSGKLAEAKLKFPSGKRLVESPAWELKIRIHKVHDKIEQSNEFQTLA